MKWMTGTDWACAYGDEFGYLVVTTERDVRLSRFSIFAAGQGLAARLAAEVARSVIIFPLGRGPGRPGGALELAALAESARTYAERCEGGESLEGYPAWGKPAQLSPVGPPLREHCAEPECPAFEPQHLDVPVYDTEVEMYCLAHRKRVRWLAAPMWWHHVSDKQSCSRMHAADAPRVDGRVNL